MQGVVVSCFFFSIAPPPPHATFFTCQNKSKMVSGSDFSGKGIQIRSPDSGQEVKGITRKNNLIINGYADESFHRGLDGFEFGRSRDQGMGRDQGMISSAPCAAIFVQIDCIFFVRGNVVNAFIENVFIR